MVAPPTEEEEERERSWYDRLDAATMAFLTRRSSFLSSSFSSSDGGGEILVKVERRKKTTAKGDQTNPVDASDARLRFLQAIRDVSASNVVSSSSNELEALASVARVRRHQLRQFGFFQRGYTRFLHLMRKLDTQKAHIVRVTQWAEREAAAGTGDWRLADWARRETWRTLVERMVLLARLGATARAFAKDAVVQMQREHWANIVGLALGAVAVTWRGAEAEAQRLASAADALHRLLDMETRQRLPATILDAFPGLATRQRATGNTILQRMIRKTFISKDDDSDGMAEEEEEGGGGDQKRAPPLAAIQASVIARNLSTVAMLDFGVPVSKEAGDETGERFESTPKDRKNKTKIKKKKLKKMAEEAAKKGKLKKKKTTTTMKKTKRVGVEKKKKFTERTQ